MGVTLPFPAGRLVRANTDPSVLVTWRASNDRSAGVNFGGPAWPGLDMKAPAREWMDVMISFDVIIVSENRLTKGAWLVMGMPFFMVCPFP